jgi:hypothetical protein
MNLYYQIEGLFPHKELTLGSCGFLVSLDISFAERALSTPLDTKQEKRWQTEGSELIKRLNIGGLCQSHAYHFWKDTSLLQFCAVPGNATDLGVEPSDIEFIEQVRSSKIDHTNLLVNYTPHNVDSPLQAYGLLGLWTHWANSLRFI